MMTTTSRALSALILGAMVVLGGCASTDWDSMGDAVSKLPVEDRSCQVTLSDGVVIKTHGEKNCQKLMDQVAADRAREQANAICSGDSVTDYRDKALCVDQVMDGSVMTAMANNRGGAPTERRETAREQGLMLMMQEARNRSNERIAWISAIPAFGNIAATVYQSHESGKTMRTALRNGGTRVGSVHVSKSDDGTATSGEGAATGTGGNGDQYVTIGNRNQAIPGDGSIITDGRNPVLIGTGQPDSSLDPSTVNNQNAGAPDNPINNAPVTQTSDDDGGQSIIPSL